MFLMEPLTRSQLCHMVESDKSDMATTETTVGATPVRRNPTLPCRNPVGFRATPPPTEVAVVVVCHNYGGFLSECLESVLAQTHAACEIVVVDDSSTDNTPDVAELFRERGVQYLRVEHRNVYQTRRSGLDATRSEVLCFLDADDLLEPAYLEQGLRAFSGPNIAVVYSDLRKFGASDGVSKHPREFSRDRMAADNYLHAGSLVLREPLIQSRAFELAIDPLRTQADWFLWRRVLTGPWQARMQTALYLYRQHETNWTHAMRKEAHEYFEYAGLAHESVTLFVPLSGRTESWECLSRFLDCQEWPHSQTQLILLDTSGSSEFSLLVRHWIAKCDYPDIRHMQVSVAQSGLADEDRHQEEVRRQVRLAMSRIYHVAAVETVSDYLWILEDDITPPTDVCRQLLRGFDAHTASVSAVYCSRFDQQPCVWDQHRQHYQPIPTGLRAVHGNGFGCVILRGGVLRATAFRHSDDYDRIFYDQLSSAGWISKVDWSVGCRHGNVEPPFTPPTDAPCSCCAAGWCERHQCDKNEHWWQLCRTRPDYVRLWEEGRGPGQNIENKPTGSEPSLLRKAWNFGTAVVRHASSGMQNVDDGTYTKRLDICRACSSCDVPRMVCQEMNCGCALYIKARWTSERCPKDKWQFPSEGSEAL